MVDSVKEFLNKAKAYMSPDFHTGTLGQTLHLHFWCVDVSSAACHWQERLW